MTLGSVPAPEPGQPEVDSAGLGRLTHVAQPREVWLTEAGHFTPWLADNLDVLAEEMGLSPTLTATEVPVGEFRLDIKAETADGRVVIIENQLERTDHGHLGQLPVYASGLEAAIVVWVAPAFRDDHRRTLDWLNERTDEGVSFFGVEVGIVQIGNGRRAPVFDVVAHPNDWQKHVKAVAGGGPQPVITPLDEVRQEFFLEALTEIALAKPGIRIPSEQSANWLSFASGPFGYWAISVTQDHRIRLEAYLDSGDQERSKRLFDYAGRASPLCRDSTSAGNGWTPGGPAASPVTTTKFVRSTMRLVSTTVSGRSPPSARCTTPTTPRFAP